MQKNNKIKLTLGLLTTAVASIHLINRHISKNATKNKITFNSNQKKYKWKLGDIYYTVSGSGEPIILIHNLSSDSSSYEWNSVVSKLSLNNTVYSIDLLGCGYSDKPNITYTAYMYTQLINDFISNIINEKVTIIASSNSVSIAVISAYFNPDLYNEIILVNPESLSEPTNESTSHKKLVSKIINTPILGTFVYNTLNTKNTTYNKIDKKIYNKSVINDIVNYSHETSHLSGCSAKNLYVSTECGNTCSYITKALQSLHNISIIIGKEKLNSNEILKQYTDLNNHIDAFFISSSTEFPHIEEPIEFCKTINFIMNEK